MFCSNCGSRADGKFCSACGHALQAVVAEPAEIIPIDWSNEINYERLISVPEVRDRVAAERIEIAVVAAEFLHDLGQHRRCGNRITVAHRLTHGHDVWHHAVAPGDVVVVDRNCHTIEVDSDSARYKLSIENIPSENPKTGRNVALSVIAALRKMHAPMAVGT